jgi:hypothetical protein
MNKPASQIPTAGPQIFLDPGMEIQWQAQTTQNEPGQVTSGTGMVGPDGTVVIGPYGTCKVAGLSLAQATAALEEHLAAYMKTPTVRLSATVPASQVDVAWRSAGSRETVVETAGANSIQPVSWAHTSGTAEPARTVVSQEPDQQVGGGALLRRVFSKLGLTQR